MSTRRFGGSPAYSYSVKLRWIVGGLSGVVLVLLMLLTGLLLQAKEPPAVAITQPTEAWASPLSLVSIVVAKQRIEEGMEIDPSMLASQGVPADSIPEGSIRELDRQQLIGKFARQLIPSGSPIIGDLLTSDSLAALNQIPADMRAVTITLDSRQSVEWFIKPGSRVDVILTAANERNEKQVTPIVPFAKVYSVSRNTNPNAANSAAGGDVRTVTLVVSEIDSRKIELGRTIGTLSLTLVGDTVNPGVREPKLPVGVADLFPRQNPQHKGEERVGTFWQRDPVTGQRREMMLTPDGRWVEVKS